MRYRCFSFVLVVIAMFSYAMPSQAQQQEDIVDRLNASLGVFLPNQYQTTVKNFVMNSKILSDKEAQTFTELFIKEQMNTNWGIDKQNQLLFIWDAVYGQILNNKQLYTGEDGNQARLDEFEKVMEKAEACGKKYNEGFKAYMKQRSADAERRSAEAQKRSAEAQKRSAEEKLKTINKNITSIKGFIKSIRDGLAKLEAKKKNGNVSAETERGIIDFSKREKEIVAKFDVLNKSIQNIKTEELDQQLSSSNQLVSESAKLVSAISKQRSAEAQKRSADAERRSAEAQKRSAEADRSFAEARQQNVIITYSGLYLNTDFYTMRHAASESEIKQTKEFFKHNVNNCKKYKIDFQFLLPTEVQKFYDLTPVQQNSLTCDKAIVQIINIVLEEIVKLYNLYQKAPQAKREIPDFNSFIDACKKHNIDYKKELTPEMLKYFGIE